MSCPKMKGGLEMRMTPLRRPAAATTLNTPHRSLRMNMESTITITGLENRMVVESPSGSREKLVKMKRIRSPPVTATAQHFYTSVNATGGKTIIALHLTA